MLSTPPPRQPPKHDYAFFAAGKSSHGSPVKSPAAASGTSVVVTARVVPVQRPKNATPGPNGSSLLSSLSSMNSSSSASPSSATTTTTASTRKRKSPERDDPHSNAGVADAPPATAAAPQRKKQRVSPPGGSTKPNASGKGKPKNVAAKAKRRVKSSTPSTSRASSRPLSPEPIYRGSRSRSTSHFPVEDAPIPRDCWIEEDGTPGPGFLSCEEVVRGLMKSYKGYFKNPDDPNDTSFGPHPTDYPVVELEYPNTDACERFILLQPKDKDHYNPIMCLEKSLYTIVECYMTPEQQCLFGTIPTDILSDVSPPPSPSPSPSPPNSRASSSSSSSSLSSLTSLSSSPSSPHSLSRSASSQPPLQPQSINYLRAVQRAIHTQNGPLFMKTMARVNALIRSLKYPPLPSDPFADPPKNALREAVKGWSAEGMPKKVLLRIMEETYQRCVGPKIPQLRKYESWSSEVYGELNPTFISDLISTTRLTPNSLFVDMGSGVGNVVLQAALQSGCRAYGVEVMEAPAEIADRQRVEWERRCRMWGVRKGGVELEWGDMLSSSRVDEALREADVVLVNNKVFSTQLNEKLKPKFLDLKEGAIIVSLQPFVAVNARVTERNVDDISAIFEVTQRPYHSGAVSWGASGGHYYIHRVDREGYAIIKAKWESSRANSRAGSVRPSRARRS